MNTPLSRRAFGLSVLALVAAASLSGCGVTYADRTDDLNHQFNMGQRSRKMMLDKRATVDGPACADMWKISGASGHHEHSGHLWSEVDDEPYKRTRQAYFVSGCTGDKTPTPSPSPSATR